LLEQLGYSRHEFDMLQPPKRCRIDLTRATDDELDIITELASRQIPGELAVNDVVRKVTQHNPNNLLVFKQEKLVVGGWSMLMLSAAGLEALLLGEIDLADPNPKYLANPTEAPKAIYVWAVVAPKLAAEGIRHVSKFLRAPIYRQANLFSRPNTDVGVQLNLRLGFKPIGPTAPGYYRYVRLANRSF
jgi:hypothetical protein